MDNNDFSSQSDRSKFEFVVSLNKAKLDQTARQPSKLNLLCNTSELTTIPHSILNFILKKTSYPLELYLYINYRDKADLH